MVVEMHSIKFLVYFPSAQFVKTMSSGYKKLNNIEVLASIDIKL